MSPARQGLTCPRASPGLQGVRVSSRPPAARGLTNGTRQTRTPLLTRGAPSPPTSPSPARVPREFEGHIPLPRPTGGSPSAELRPPPPTQVPGLGRRPSHGRTAVRGLGSGLVLPRGRAPPLSGLSFPIRSVALASCGDGHIALWGLNGDSWEDMSQPGGAWRGPWSPGATSEVGRRGWQGACPGAPAQVAAFGPASCHRGPGSMAGAAPEVASSPPGVRAGLADSQGARGNSPGTHPAARGGEGPARRPAGGGSRGGLRGGGGIPAGAGQGGGGRP